jgi:hypothetical protein
VKQPLIMRNGLFQSAEDEKVQIKRLNLGPSEPLLVTGSTINVNSTLHHLISSSGFSFVDTINGGEEGDLLILTGERVRLRRGGNIASPVRLIDDKAKSLIFINSEWVPW